MLAFVIKNAQFYNNINTTIINANIKTTWKSLESLFIGFFIVILNLKNLEQSIKYKKKAINNITQNIYNKKFLLQRIKHDNIYK